VRRLFLLVATVILVDSLFYASITPLLPHYRDELGLSKTGAGILSGSYAAGTLLASIPSGYLAARRGPKVAVVTGLALLAGSSVAFAFGQTVAVLDTARFVQGIGGACSWAGGLAWLIRMAPDDRRGELIGAVLAAAIGGFVLGPALGGAAVATSPELVFTLVGVVALGLIAWALALPAPRGCASPPLREVADAVFDRRVVAGFTLVALPALYAGTVEVLAPLRLDELGASGVAIGGIFLVSALIEGSISPVVGRMSDRRGRFVPLRLGLVLAVPAAFLLPLPETVVLEAAIVLATLAALATFWAPAMALLSEAIDATGIDQAFAGAITNLAWAGGQVAGGTGGAALAEATSDSLPYALLGLLCGVALVTVGRRKVAAVTQSS
jgi:MFS family permease